MIKWKKVMGTSVLTISLLFASFSPIVGKSGIVEAKSNPVLHNTSEFNLPFMSRYTGGPFDLGVANQEKVLESLIKQGIIDKNASKEEKQKKLITYLKNRAENAEELTADLDNPKQLRADIQEAAGVEPVPAGIPKENKSTNLAKNSKANQLHSIVEEEWGGPVQKDQVLVLLIDFPDYPHSSITEEDGPVLFYEDYTKEHYEQMIFGETSYKGGNGEDFISMREFYEQQSGGSYTIDGAVSDWYTAKHPASYYGGNSAIDGNDERPRELVMEALIHASQDPAIDLKDFDKEDIFDLDGDGNYREPDGIIDHLMVVHAGTGEEAGGGALGADAIWSHRWNLGTPSLIPNTDGFGEGDIANDYWGGNLVAFDYTMQPEDGATGVFAHEYGHDLGLPDEYDTIYSGGGVGAPVDYWSIMASGSWAGTIGGTEPTGFSPYAKEYLQKKWPESNWFKSVEYNLEDIKDGKKTVNIDQASIKGTNADGVKVKLPDKITNRNTPVSGKFSYYSGQGNNLDNNITTTVDLTNATEAEFSFYTNYSIESDWDYASVQVNDGEKWMTVSGNITTNDNPNGQNPGDGITGESNGWVKAIFDLSAFAGKKIKVKVNYWTDVAAVMPGIYVDDLSIKVDGEEVIFDDTESDESPFILEGFTKSDGNDYTEHYYLVEWRNWAAADTALGNLSFGMTLDPGMVVWYVDNKYDNNWVGEHPGEGFLGVVDAHQESPIWTDDGSITKNTRYHIQDAAFSLQPTDEMALDFSPYYGPGVFLSLESQPSVSTFDDYHDYTNPNSPTAGRNVPSYGLSISVVEQSEDNSTAQIELSYDDHEPNVQVSGLAEKYSTKDGFNTLNLSVISDDEALGETITLSAKVQDEQKQTIVFADETYTSDRKEKEFEFNLVLPEETKSGEYQLVVTISANDTILASNEHSFIVQNEAADPEIDYNGSTDKVPFASVIVTIPDAKEGTLEYLWSASSTLEDSQKAAEGKRSGISELNVWKPFNNGDTLTLDGHSGEYYLHIRGKDSLDNPINWTSNAFLIDADAPVIELLGENPLTLQVGTLYEEPGYTAIDIPNEEDLSDQVVISGLEDLDIQKPGEYILTYQVTDSVGNKAEVKRIIYIVDEETPFIELAGDLVVTLEAGESYEEPGYKATDNVDGDLTANVQVSSDLDTKVPGKYLITYTVLDSSGNPYSVTRTIIVQDTMAPELVLKDGDKVVLEAGEKYEEPGYTAIDNVDGDVTDNVKVTGSIDTNKVGDYVLTYNVLDTAGNEAIVTRTVTIKDTTAPEIKLSGEKAITLELGDAYLEPGFIATDVVDGNVTDHVVVTGDLRFEIGEYTITYTVTDVAGNKAVATRSVKVVDTKAPVLKLKGSRSLSINQGDTYKEPGFRATDNADGDLTNSVKVTGEVNTNKIGSYKLTYTVTDSSGNKASAVRLIVVNAVNPSTDEEKHDNNNKKEEATDKGNDNIGNKTDKNGGAQNTNNKAKSSSNKTLPETATNSYNWIITGLIILAIGSSLIIVYRRKKVKE